MGRLGFCVLVTLSLAVGCAAGSGGSDAGRRRDSARPFDAGPSTVDAGSTDTDAGSTGTDAGSTGTDAGSTGTDAGTPGMDAGTPTPDAGPPPMDAGSPGTDAGATCGPSTGMTIVYDGTDDLGDHATAQQLTPGLTGQPWERFAMGWDSDYLYIAYVSESFEVDNRPAHIYLEAGAALPMTPTQSTGKEYGGLTAALPFTATHLIAMRRVNNLGGTEYNGVYAPAAAWANRVYPIAYGTEAFVAADQHTISVRVPWTELGCPRELRLAAHIVHQVMSAPYRDAIPSTHTPGTASSMGYLYVPLTMAPDSMNWTAM